VRALTRTAIPECSSQASQLGGPLLFRYSLLSVVCLSRARTRAASFEIQGRGSGELAATVEIENRSEVKHALRNWGLGAARPVIVVVGGAGSLNEKDRVLPPLFRDGIAAAAEEAGAAVVDGGTDAGVMRLMGVARQDIGASFPLVGVTAVGTVRGEDSPGLEPHHTHQLLVPGDRWGDESSWLSLVASELSQGQQSVTVLVNGGATSRRDLTESIAARRPVVVIGQTGRLANEIASSSEPEIDYKDRAAPEDVGRFVVIPDPSNPVLIAERLADMLRSRLDQ
jgi:hypothetical protein